MSNTCISTLGLFADAAGAALLGVDLIRLQFQIKHEAEKRKYLLDGLAEDYGGVTAWAAQIKKDSRWVRQHEYEDYIADDEDTFNAHNIIERTQELSDCVNGLGEHISRITTYLGEIASGDKDTAASSLRYSIIGLILLFAGFALQTVGTLS